MSTPTPDGWQADPKNTHAIVVGVEKILPSGDLDDRPGPVGGAVRFTNWRDDRPGLVGGAVRFTNWLLDRGVPPGNIRLLVAPAPLRPEDPANPEDVVSANGEVRGQPVSWEAVDEALAALQATKTGKLLWVYWAGHGFNHLEDSHRHDLLVLPSKRVSSLNNVDAENLIARLQSEEELGSIERVACFFDSCRQDTVGLRDDDGTAVGFARQKFNVADGVLDDRRDIFRGYAVQEGDSASFPGYGRPALFSEKLLTVLEGTPKEPVDTWPPDLAAVADKVLLELVETGYSPQFRLWGGTSVELRPSAQRLPKPTVIDHLVAVAADELRELFGKRAPKEVGELSAHLSVPVPSRTVPDGLDQLDDLVKACLQQGQIRNLYRAVRMKSVPDSCQGRVRRALLELVPSVWLTWDEFWELKEIIRYIEDGRDGGKNWMPLALLRQLAGIGPATEVNRDSDVLTEILDSGLKPAAQERLIAFVEYLAAWYGDSRSRPSAADIARRLRDWNRRVARAHGIEKKRARFQTRAGHASRVGLLDPSMLISVKRSTAPADHRYAVKAWLWLGIGLPEPGGARADTRPNIAGLGLKEPDDLLPEAEVCAWLRRLLDGEVAGRLGRDQLTRLRLEFFVAPDLLGAGVKKLLQNCTVPLYREYAVLMRSLTRNNEPSHFPNWAQKWDKLLAVRRATGRATRFTPSINGSLSGKPTEDLCVILTQQPEPSSLDALHTTLLSSGTPAAFWPGSDDVTMIFDAEAEKLVSQSPLAGLPRRLGERQQANPSLYDVVLLWDDPYRFAPTSRVSDHARRT